MSDALISYYDATRKAVIIMRESGSEVAVLDCDDANSLGTEILAASEKQSTGYEEYLAQGDPQRLLSASGYGLGAPAEATLADVQDALVLIKQAHPEKVECVLTETTIATEDDCSGHPHRYLG